MGVFYCKSILTIKLKMKCQGTTLPASLFAFYSTKYEGACICHPLSAQRVMNLTTMECVSPQDPLAYQHLYFVSLAAYILYQLFWFIEIFSEPCSLTSAIHTMTTLLQYSRACVVFGMLFFHPWHELNWHHAMMFWAMSSFISWMNELGQSLMERSIRNSQQDPRMWMGEYLIKDGICLLIYAIVFGFTWVENTPFWIIYAIGVDGCRFLINACNDANILRSRHTLDKKERMYFYHMICYNALECVYRLWVIYMLVDIPQHRGMVLISYLIGIYPSAMYDYAIYAFLEEEEDEDPLREQLIKDELKV